MKNCLQSLARAWKHMAAFAGSTLLFLFSVLLGVLPEWKRVVARLRAILIVSLAIFGTGALTILVLYEQSIREERNAYVEIIASMRNNDPPRARDIVEMHVERFLGMAGPLTHFRLHAFGLAWDGAESPQFLFLAGIVYARLGEYGTALAYYQKANEHCGLWQAYLLPQRQSFCSALEAESFFWSGDALAAQRDKGAYSNAMRLYQKGLLLHPDDVSGKRALEWLLAYHEGFMVLGGGDELEGLSRNDPLVDLDSLKEYGGDSERRGY